MADEKTVDGRSAVSVVRIAFAVLLLFVPALVLNLTPIAPLTKFTLVGLIPTLLALLHGRPFAVATAVVTAALVAVALTANPYPIAAAVVMAAVGLGIGASAVRGWQGTAAIVATWPAILLVSDPVQFPPGAGIDTAATIWIATGVALVGGVFTVLVARIVLPGIHGSGFTPIDRPTSVVYGLALAVLLGGTAFVASAWWHGTTAGWVLLTILIVARPGYHEAWQRIVARSVGTIGGGIAAAGVAFVAPGEILLTVVGAISLIVAIALLLKKANYAVYAGALTAAIVLLASPTASSVVNVDLQRVGFTLVGALLAAVVVTALELVLTRLWAPRAT